MSFKVGGHRGMGCTDHDFYVSRRDISLLPVENTIESKITAFRNGADYIETDAVSSRDGVIFTLHNVVPKDHFFGDKIPATVLNEMAFADIERYGVGRLGKGRVSRLSESLEAIARVDPHTADFVINIEIKGVQGSGQKFEDNDFLVRLAKIVKASPIPATKILFSSFSLANILKMSQLMPDSRYGMLFAELPDPRPIYADHRDDPEYCYLPFNSASISQVIAVWHDKAAAGVKLSYLHPEITTIDPATLAATATHGKGINCWALFEEWSETSQKLYEETAAACCRAGILFTAITNYVAEMKNMANPRSPHECPNPPGS